MTLALVLLFMGGLAVFAGVKDQKPWQPVLDAFGGDGGTATATAARTTTVLDICTNPPTLQTWQGVRLEPLAMAAFKAAQSKAGGAIVVNSSYRSCDEQAADCERICGNPQGCPGLCAKPGESKHQYGDAVDVTNWEFALPYLEGQGWCHPLPGSDPGHFSFLGCG